VVGDSFFWGMFNLSLEGKAFKDVKYWYYFNSVYPENFEKPTTVKDFNFIEELKNADLVLLMGCPPSLNNLGWGFIERGFRELVLGLQEEAWQAEYLKMIRETEQSIRNSPEWLEHVREKARKLDVPLDTMIYRDARYMIDLMIQKGDF